VSRIDPEAKQEYLALFNNGAAPASVTVTTSTPSAAWTALLGTASATSDAAGKLTVSVPATGALLLKAGATVPSPRVAAPKLVVKADALSNLWTATATVRGSAPVSVAFAVKRAGSTKWQRLSVDTSPPYRGFIDPAKFRRNERVQVGAVVRSLDGSSSAGAVVPFRVRAH
jgi:hypothetical protein